MRCAVNLIVALLFFTIAGCCGGQRRQSTGPLARLVFRPSVLPKNVRLAPEKGGSCKLPQVTGNPYVSSDREFISQFEDGKVVEKGTVSEVLLVAYWTEEPDGAPVEISVTALRFAEAPAAGRAAAAMRPKMDEHAKAEPHTAPRLIHRGSVVCILGHTSAVHGDVWSAMVRLVEEALKGMP